MYDYSWLHAPFRFPVLNNFGYILSLSFSFWQPKRRTLKNVDPSVHSVWFELVSVTEEKKIDYYYYFYSTMQETKKSNNIVKYIVETIFGAFLSGFDQKVRKRNA